MIYVVHIVKEIKSLSCNWMDYVSLKKENVTSVFVLIHSEIQYQHMSLTTSTFQMRSDDSSE